MLVRHDRSESPNTPRHVGAVGLRNAEAVKSCLCLHERLLGLNVTGLPLGLVGQKGWAPVATGEGIHSCRPHRYNREIPLSSGHESGGQYLLEVKHLCWARIVSRTSMST